jgi:hypothetical protein
MSRLVIGRSFGPIGLPPEIPPEIHPPGPTVKDIDILPTYDMGTKEVVLAIDPIDPAVPSQIPENVFVFGRPVGQPVPVTAQAWLDSTYPRIRVAIAPGTVSPLRAAFTVSEPCEGQLILEYAV